MTENFFANIIYFIMPLEKAIAIFGNNATLTKKNFDDSLCLWDLANTDSCVEELKNDKDISFYSHAEIIEILKTDEWKEKKPWE